MTDLIIDLADPTLLNVPQTLPEDELYYNKETCPICGNDGLYIEGRCTTCLDCGWSKCNL